jgi:hypothetical protein
MANKKINELDSRASLSLSDLMAVGDPSTGYLYKTTISDLKTLTGAGVVSFNGRFGSVVPAEGDYSLTQLSDVIITSASNGQVLQYNGSNWVNATIDLSGYVPYTGATANVNLGTFDLTADVITGATGSFASSGGSNTFAINHSSGSGIALNITKGGNSEGIYVNKTGGSGNAATIVGTLEATTLVKTGGTSSQFLKADGSVDSSTYLTTSSAASTYVPYSGATGGLNLGIYALSNSSTFINGDNTSSFGYLGFKQFSGGSTGLNGYTSIFASGSNSLSFQYSQGPALIRTATFSASLLSNNTTYTYNFPAADGTLALTSDLASYLPLAGGTLTGALNINVASGTGLNVASENVVFRAGTGFATPRQITFAAGNGPTTYLEAKGYGGNYITDFGIRTYNSSGTAFEVFFATSAGDVGIGNTAPAAKLDVNGTGRFTNNLAIGATLSAWISSAKVLQLNNTAALYAPTDESILSNNVFVDSGDNNKYITTNFASQYRQVSGQHLFYSAASGTAGATISFGTPKLTITSGGNVGIGTSSPTDYSGYTTLHINGKSGSNSGVVRITAADGSSGFNMYSVGAAQFNTTSAVPFIFLTQDTERMRITSGGSVCIGRTSAPSSAYKLAVDDAVYMRVATNGNNMINFFNQSETYVASIVVNASSVAYNTSSDYRLKEDLKDFGGLSLLSNIKVYDFAWKLDNTRTYGVVAHELAEVLPSAVSGEKDGENIQGVDYSKLVPILVKSIQELESRIKQLENKII